MNQLLYTVSQRVVVLWFIFTCFGVTVTSSGETADASDAASDAAMTSNQQQVSAPPRPTRRLTGLRSHTLPDQHRPSFSSAGTDSNLPEETSPGEMLLT